MSKHLSSKQKKRLVIYAVIIIAALYSFISDKLDRGSFSDSEKSIENASYVHFLSVGQGDCTLIETYDGKYALIDASTQDYSDIIVSYLFNEGVEELEFVLFTHPHEDHIGGGDEVLNAFPVKTVYMTDKTENTSSYNRLLNAVKSSKKKNSTEVIKPEDGDIFELGNIKFQILSDGDKYEDLNNSSICLKMELGKSTFIFTGDAEKEVEYDILDKDMSVSAEVYKCGHHGSSTSNSDAFLDAVNPHLAIISCGLDNSYGHPHAEVVEALEERGVVSKRTDTDGTIVVAFNENTIAVNSAF